MLLWFPVLDLARAPRRTARKKGSGYENDLFLEGQGCQDPRVYASRFSRSGNEHAAIIGKNKKKS
jgi:hypothetical protein